MWVFWLFSYVLIWSKSVLYAVTFLSIVSVRTKYYIIQDFWAFVKFSLHFWNFNCNLQIPWAFLKLLVILGIHSLGILEILDTFERILVHIRNLDAFEKFSVHLKSAANVACLYLLATSELSLQQLVQQLSFYVTDMIFCVRLCLWLSEYIWITKFSISQSFEWNSCLVIFLLSFGCNQ